MIRYKCYDYLDAGSDICYFLYAAIQLVAGRFSTPLRQLAVGRGPSPGARLGTRLVMKYVLSGRPDDNESLGFHWNCIAVNVQREMLLSIKLQTDAASF